MKDRIRKVMEWANLSQQDFAARLEVSPASLSSIFTGRTNPTSNHVNAIHRVFPEININWLMFGEGDMLIAGTGEQAGVAAGATSVPISEEGTAAAAANAAVSGFLFPVSDLDGSAERPVATAQSNPRAAGHYSSRQQPSRERENVKYIERPVRKIKEIRVFFDDGTYESFTPAPGR